MQSKDAEKQVTAPPGSLKICTFAKCSPGCKQMEFKGGQGGFKTQFEENDSQQTA